MLMRGCDVSQERVQSATLSGLNERIDTGLTNEEKKRKQTSIGGSGTSVTKIRNPSGDVMKMTRLNPAIFALHLWSLTHVSHVSESPHPCSENVDRIVH